MQSRGHPPLERRALPSRDLAKSFCALAIIFLVCLCSLFKPTRYSGAQDSHGEINGVVFDAASVPIPSVHVFAQNLTTGATSQSMSDANGHFSFSKLPPGNYKIKAEKNGFSSLTQQPVEVTARKQATLRLEMKVAPAKDDILTIPTYAVSPHEVHDVFFLDSQHGWIVAEDHKRNLYDLFQTTNDGKAWTELSAPRGIGQTYFIDSQKGWALRGIKSRGRYYTYLLRTRNGGVTWSRTMRESLEERLRPDEFVVRMAFSNDNVGWFFTEFSGPAGSVLVTKDGGKSVQASDTPNHDRDYRGIFTLPSGRVWVLGEDTILSSSDEGATWQQQFSWIEPRPQGEAYLFSGWFFPSGRGWVVGQEIDKGIILGTHDFGRHWNRLFESAESLYLESAYFSDEKNGCAVGLSDHLFCTQDGGITWTDRNVLPPSKGTQANFFIRIVMLKSGKGFVLRAGGFLYETEDGGQSWHAFDPLSVARKK